MRTEPDQVRWFDAVGTCICGKPAHGHLMGPRNEKYGAYCAKCANTRLDKAKREREAYAADDVTRNTLIRRDRAVQDRRFAPEVDAPTAFGALSQEETYERELIARDEWMDGADLA